MTGHRYPLRLVVDGETFVVGRRGTRTFDYDWVSGPNAGYGYSETSWLPREQGGPPPVSDGTDAERTLEQHEQSIRDFLSMIDPETGFIGDDDE